MKWLCTGLGVQMKSRGGLVAVQPQVCMLCSMHVTRRNGFGGMIHPSSANSIEGNRWRQEGSSSSSSSDRNAMCGHVAAVVGWLLRVWLCCTHRPLDARRWVLVKQPEQQMAEFRRGSCTAATAPRHALTSRHITQQYNGTRTTCCTQPSYARLW